MMTPQQRAVNVITAMHGATPEDTAQALADAGLIAPELPKPDRSLAFHTEVWNAVQAVTTRKKTVMVGINYYTPAEARQQALAILAGAAHAENWTP